MIDREKKYTDDLAACRKSIERTRGLIDYHKNMLKTLEAKEKELSGKLCREKFSAFYSLVESRGYDVDMLRSAFENGDFTAFAVVSADKSEGEIPAEKEKNIDDEKEKIADEND